MLLATFYVCLGLLITSVEVRRIRAGRRFDALTFFNGAYFLFFVFVPLNILAFGEAAVRQKYAYQTWSHGDFWTALSLSLAYVVFVLGYYKRSRNSLPVGGNLREQLSHFARWIAVAFLLIGVVAMAYHVNLMGGLLETLYLAPQARTGKAGQNGNFLFIRQFSVFAATAFTLCWAAYLDSSASKLHDSHSSRIGQHLLIALMGCAFVYYALSTYGRREFLYPIFACLVVWAFAGSRRHWGALLWLLMLGMLWSWLYVLIIPAAQTVLLEQQLSVVSGIKPETISAAQTTQLGQIPVPISSLFRDMYFGTIQGLGDSFMHYVAAEHAALWQFGFLTDLREMPAQFLPSQILGFDRPRGMFGETSEFILGRPLEPGLSGEEPLGLHGYLLVNFAYPGMMLLFYLAGTGYRALDAILRPEKYGPALQWLVFVWVVLGALAFLREGLLVLILKQHMSWWLASGILIWFARQKGMPPEAHTHRQSTINTI